VQIVASAILSTLMQESASHLRSWFAAMCLGTAAWCSAAHAQEAWIIELAPLPGDVATQPASGSSIAQSGLTQVGNSISATARQRAIRSIGGVVSPLGVLPGLTSSVAAACSLDGSTIVGFCIGGAPARAFRWVNGVMSDLGTPPVSPAILPALRASPPAARSSAAPFRPEATAPSPGAGSIGRVPTRSFRCLMVPVPTLFAPSAAMAGSSSATWIATALRSPSPGALPPTPSRSHHPPLPDPVAPPQPTTTRRSFLASAAPAPSFAPSHGSRASQSRSHPFSPPIAPGKPRLSPATAG